MLTFANPAPGLADVAHVFEEGAQAGGLQLDAELCRDIAHALQDAAEVVVRLADALEAEGLLERTTVPIADAFARPREPAERRRLAARAVAADPNARVVRFPLSHAQPATVAEGGTAA